MITELKSWPIIRTFQRRVDVYFHLLSVPRGKGGFYCFIGVLAFCSSDWNLSRVCVLIVSLVGIVHLFACQRCGAPADGGGSESLQHVQSGSCSGAASESSAAFTWQGLMKEVVSDSPEVVGMGISVAAGAASSSLGGGGGGESNNNNGSVAAAPAPPPEATPLPTNYSNM